MIPLQNLDQLNLKSINVGVDSLNEFDRILWKYSLVDFQTFDLEKDTFESQPEIKDGLTILHLHLDELFDLSFEAISELQRLIDLPSTISVVFDERGILNSFPVDFENAPGI